MAVAAMETNLNGVKEAEVAILSVDKGDKQTRKIRRMSYEEFHTVGIVSSVIKSINLVAFFCMFLLVVIQFHGWKKSFKNNWDSDIQMQYNQMHLSAILYSIIFLAIFFIEMISSDGLDHLINIRGKIHWTLNLSFLLISMCLSFILVVFVCPSKAAESVAQYIVEVEYTLSKIPNALVHLKFLCILSSIQHIFLITIMVLMKPKDFNINFVNDRYSSNAVTKREEKEIENISETYVIC